jgi:putative transposase
VGTGKPYGLQRVCRVLDFPRSTLYAQQAAAKVVPLRPQRRGPKPKVADADLLAAIVNVARDFPRFVGVNFPTL